MLIRRYVFDVYFGSLLLSEGHFFNIEANLGLILEIVECQIERVVAHMAARTVASKDRVVDDVRGMDFAFV